MLEFFRKYQYYFFLVITVIIIISFSFFGTYSTLSQGNYHEQIAFTAINGTPIKRSELDHLMLFIGTDAEDKLLFGGAWGPNFLNDGVIKKDFLQTGLAELLAAQYSGDIEQDLETRLEKEKRYTPYVHPEASFFGAEAVWSYFAPGLKQNFQILRSSSTATDPDALAARINLYLAEKKFPAPALRQVLAYQQQQYGWLKPDSELNHTDLSLFGYHTLDDWFGPRFTRLIGEFIINSSIIAENKGYYVPQTEALADLMRNSEISFKQNIQNPNLGVANSAEYFNEQLNRMGLDQTKAALLWQKVLLFRRLFHDMGNSVFVDPNTFQKLNEYARETIEGDLYRLPKDLHFNNFNDLQEFEIYLDAISKRFDTEKELLSLPTQFFSIEEVAKKNPELIQKRYLLDIAHVDKDALGAKVGIRETWNWEVEDKNWSRLKQLFPSLGIKKGDTKEERFAALDSLDDKTRATVDAFARHQIIDSHPEWLEKALEDADAKKLTLGLKLKGGKTPIIGLTDREGLMKILDQAKLGEQDPALSQYTADDKNYYRMIVIDRTPKKEILTFAEAHQNGTLEKTLKKTLEAYFQNHKEENNWNTFSEVQDQVADLYFAPLLKAIRNDYAAAIAPEPVPKQMIREMSASLRFYAYVRQILKNLETNPKEAQRYISISTPSEKEDHLAERAPLGDQWKLEKSFYRTDRSNEDKEVNLSEAFAIAPGTWTKVFTPPNGNLYFFELIKKGSDANATALTTKVDEARQLLGDDAQRVLMENLLREMKAKHAISLDYLSHGTEMTSDG